MSERMVSIRATDLKELWEGYCGTFELSEADSDQLRLGLRVRKALGEDEGKS